MLIQTYQICYFAMIFVGYGQYTLIKDHDYFYSRNKQFKATLYCQWPGVELFYRSVAIKKDSDAISKRRIKKYCKIRFELSMLSIGLQKSGLPGISNGLLIGKPETRK